MLSSIIGGLGLFYISYQTALFAVGYSVTKSNTLSDLANRLLQWVYIMTSVVIGSWFIFGAAAGYIITFAIIHAGTICFVDLENTFEANKDL